MPFLRKGVLAALPFLSLALANPVLAQQPSAPAHPIQILSATPSATETPAYGRLEIVVVLQATFDNPFDPEQIALDAHVTTSSGKTYDQPGFYYQPFERENNGETLKPNGEPSWHIRLALSEPGVNKIVVSAKDKTGTAQSKEIDINVTPSSSHGFIVVSPRDFHFFEHSDGSTFFPIGATLPTHKGITDLETWMPALQSSGANTARLILGPANAPLALVTKRSGASKIDLANAWKLDQAMDLMAKDNVSAILCLDNFNELRERDFDPQWTNSPYDYDNGGPLTTNTQFWSSPAIDKLYDAKLRYVVARYGAYTNVIAYELWRDIDLVHQYDPEVVRPWIDKHSQILKSLDPYGHLVTISYADPIGERSIDHLPGIDFVQSHVYNYPDLVPQVTLNQYRKAGYGKPHLVTEVAAESTRDRSAVDTNGLQVHDPLWSSIASGAAGAAMPWWWDTYVYPRHIFNRFGAVAAFTKGIDWAGQNFKTTTPAFTFQQPLAAPMYRDLMIENGPISFGNTEYNLPRHVRIWPYGVQYGLPVSGVLQGQKRHPSKFNPITFTMDIKRPTQFDLIVGDVSGAGGASIQIKLDGEIVMGLDLADPNDLADVEPITKYRGTYSLHIPAGHHELIVADIGNDWVQASYRFRDLLSRKSPPLLAYCLAGDSVAIAWIRHSDRSWDRIENQKRSVVPCPPTTMMLQNLLPGSWSAELWDTWSGKIIKTTRVTVRPDGMGAVNLPEISADIAVKLTKAPAKQKPAKKQ